MISSLLIAALRLVLILSLLISGLLSSTPLIAQSIVDYGDPASVVNAVFRAARNQHFAVLAELCDPEGENDDTTQRICDLPETEDDHAEFVEAFEIGEINGEIRIDKKAGFAIVPITGSDNGDPINVFFTLILRNPDLEGGEWYLYCLGEEPCVEINPPKSNAGKWAPAGIQEVGKGRRNEAYGIPSLSIGDVNGDGFDDIAIGSFGNPGAGIAGRVQIYHGSADGVVTKLTWKVGNKEWTDLLGDEHTFAPFNIGRIGDVNGDGFDDLAVTVADLASDDPLVALLVYPGSEDGLEKKPYQLSPPKQEGMIFGGRILRAGDVNGDTFGDVLVVSYDSIAGPAVAAVYLGSEEGLTQEPDWIVEGLNPLAETALAASSAGDVNSDGYDDLLLGSTATIDDPIASIRLYLGSEEGLASEPVWQQSNREGTSTLGISAAGLGDVNGDGLADFAFAYSEPDSKINQVYLYLGRNEPADLEQMDVEDAQIVEIKTRGRQTIGAVAAAGDVNGDGHADLLVAVGEEAKIARWRWQLLLGGTEGINPKSVFTTAAANIDSSLLQIHPVESGDFNDDGYADLVFGQAKFDFDNQQDVETGNTQIVYGGPGGEAEMEVPPSPVVNIPQPPSAKLAAAELELSKERRVEFEDGRILSLSPNGRWLLVDVDAQLCFADMQSVSETFELVHCFNWREPLGSIDWERLRWSPDSQSIAFTEDMLRLMRDSDLWVYTIEDESLRNLTDDGFNRNILRSEDPINLDISPVWSPDGKRILFVRSKRNGDAWSGTQIYTIGLNESEPTLLHNVTRDVPFAVYSGVHWQPDNNTIFYTYAATNRDDRKNGIWRYQIDKERAEHLMKSDEERGWLGLLDVTPDSQYGLVWHPNLAMVRLKEHVFSLLNLTSGEVVSIESELLEKAEDGKPIGVMPFVLLSPDGSKLLYVVSPDGESSKVVVRNLIGGEETLLYESDKPLRLDMRSGEGLFWVNDDTVFIADSPSSGILYKITKR